MNLERSDGINFEGEETGDNGDIEDVEGGVRVSGDTEISFHKQWSNHQPQ